MPTINTVTDLPSYVDMAKRMDPDGSIADIAELLAEENPIVQDAVVVEGNLTTGHRHVIRTGLPEATWRRLNYGVPRGKSRTAQVDDTTGMLEAYAEVDKDLAALNDVADGRLSQWVPRLLVVDHAQRLQVHEEPLTEGDLAQEAVGGVEGSRELRVCAEHLRDDPVPSRGHHGKLDLDRRLANASGRRDGGASGNRTWEGVAAADLAKVVHPRLNRDGELLVSRKAVRLCGGPAVVDVKADAQRPLPGDDVARDVGLDADLLRQPHPVRCLSMRGSHTGSRNSLATSEGSALISRHVLSSAWPIQTHRSTE